ncbi:MAG: carboxymuconolactone decarboxylase family protein [Vicinamibacterales bacterium]
MRAVAVTFGIAAALVAVVAAEPRLRPVAGAALNEEQRSLEKAHAVSFGTGADFRVLLAHPELVKGVLPFANYILAESTLTPRHRELLILRTAWRTKSDYLWAKHQTRAVVAGLSKQEVSAIAERPAIQWTEFEAALLRAADELHRDSVISHQTWAALAKRYGVHELMDAAFTVAEMTMIAEVVNSARVDLEAGWTSVERSNPRRTSNRDADLPLTAPRVEPVVLAQATPEIRAMLDPSGSGRDIAGVYRTFARHPKLYVPRQILSEYIRTKSTLSPRVREMLILRIGWRCRSAYEWAAHAPAGRRAGLTNDEIRMLVRSGYDGWSPADTAIVRAADELFDEDVISDATWKALDDQFDERQLLDVLITTGGYRMVSMVLNTFGVAAEPNSEPFP